MANEYREKMRERILEEEKRKEEEYKTTFVEPEEATGSRREKLEETAREEDLPLDYENIYYVGYCENYPEVKIYEYRYDVLNVYAYYDEDFDEVVMLGNLGECSEARDWIEYKKWEEKQKEKVKKYIA